MKTWRVQPGAQIEGLKLVDEPPAALGPGLVRVKIRATSLNFRDLAIAQGWYPAVTRDPLVPGSDGVGLVVETGPGVTTFKTGDRVATSFFPDWVEGRMTVPRIRTALGGGGAGTFAEEIVLPESALIRAPRIWMTHRRQR